MVSRQRESQKRHPERDAARQAVAYAVKKGKLTSRPCEVCGAPEVQAHHDDYNQPLKVRWLCSRCHGKVHGQAGVSGKDSVQVNIRLDQETEDALYQLVRAAGEWPDAPSMQEIIRRLIRDEAARAASGRGESE